MLHDALAQLKVWQSTRTRKQRSGRCLEAIRDVVGKAGLRLPWNPWPMNTAKWCGRKLAKDPAKWGWRRVTHAPDGSLPTCLVFYEDVGELADGRVAGHVGILDGGTIYSAVNYGDNEFWGQRLKAAFVHVEEAR